jgi:YrbI family 3-deoxy-D-manno-octulosonate 8-phosphate phosphatase
MPTNPEQCRAIRLFLSDVDGVLTDSGMYYGEGGDELKRFSTLDGGGFLLLSLVGVECGVITSETTEIVARRGQKLGLDHVIQGVRDKGSALDQLLAQLDISDAEVAYIGDDINDLAVLRRVGISATVPGNFLPDDFEANYTTTRSGGTGAVREFAEWLLHQRGEYDRALSLYLESRSR